MAGGGARRGTLVAHYVAGHRRPLLDRGSPETKPGPAVANPRIRVCSTVVFSCRPLPCAIVDRYFASEPSGRRTLVPPTVETGHESALTHSEDSRGPGRAVCSGHGSVRLSRGVGRRSR